LSGGGAGLEWPSLPVESENACPRRWARATRCLCHAGCRCHLAASDPIRFQCRRSRLARMLLRSLERVSVFSGGRVTPRPSPPLARCKAIFAWESCRVFKSRHGRGDVAKTVLFFFGEPFRFQLVIDSCASLTLLQPATTSLLWRPRSSLTHLVLFPLESAKK